MTLSPTDLRDKAKPLAVSSDEFEVRCSVRTAYYACYHEICPLLRVLKGGTKIRHSDVVDFLYGVEDIRDSRFPRLHAALGREAKLAAKVYQACKEERERADYDLRGTLNGVDAGLQLRRASQLFTFAVRLNTELTRP